MTTGPTTPPLLILVSPEHGGPRSAYLTELLRLEGINWFAVRDVHERPLAGEEELPHTVLAGAGTVDDEVADRLLQHVRRGGSLLAVRPGPALALALGLGQPLALWPEAAGRYVLLDPNTPLVEGLPWVDGGVQALGPAAAYAPPNGDTATADGMSEQHVPAWFGPFPGQRSRFPAVICGACGRGRVAIFAFDPAESAVRQQQGNPAQASTGLLPDFDGDGTYRPNDLFLGQLDPALRDVPQSDLQRSLLIRILEWLTERRPLPRLWRFPGAAPAAALIDGDSDSMSVEDLRLAIETCERYGAPYATYLKPEHVEMLDPAQARAWRARGHSFGLHPWAGPRPSVDEARAALEWDAAAFAARFGYRPRLHRGHWLIWPGWVEHARTLARAGIRLDASFAAGRAFQGGYVNGTGLPAPFQDEDGEVLSVCEQSTISTDDGWLLAKTGLPALSLAGAITRSCDQIDAAVERFHTVVHPYFHPVLLRGGRAPPYPTLPWLEAVLAHCRRRDVMFLSAEEWVDWNDARRAVALEQQTSTGKGERCTGVRCTLRAPASIRDLTVMVPLPRGVSHASVAVGGEPAPDHCPRTFIRHGRAYALATISLGTGERQEIAFTWRL